MASKNYAGTQYMRAQSKEDRLLDRIDRREANGQNLDNVDSDYSEHKLTADGERVWSY